MTSTRSGQFVLASLCAALLVHVLNFPDPIRIPVVLGFALVTPGVAITQTYWSPSIFERLLVTGSISLSVLVLVATAYVAVGVWNPTLALLTVGAVSIAGYLVVDNAPTDPEHWLAWERLSSDNAPPSRSDRARILQLSSGGGLLSGPGLSDLEYREMVRLTWKGEHSLGTVAHLLDDVYTVTFVTPSNEFRSLVMKKCEAIAGLN